MTLSMRYNVGDRVNIDTAPLVGSPVPTGKTRGCTIAAPCTLFPGDAGQIYLTPDGGAGALYVSSAWLRRARKPQGQA